MKIENAKAAARLLYILLKLKIISEKRYHKLIDHLTVRSLTYQMKEDSSGESSEET